MMDHQRFDYSPIIKRRPLKWPNGARVAVWIIPNIEHFEFELPGTALFPLNLVPDVLNYGWRDYAVRVGVWRLMETLDKYGVRATVALNAAVCEHYPVIIEEGKKRNWEFMGHAYDQMPIHKVEDQAAMINRSMDILEKFTGKRPVGWLGPGLTQTLDTPELLVDAGVKYIGDWVYDDEPTVIRTAKGPLVTLPYTVEINDITMMVSHHHESDVLLKRTADAFDRLYEESADSTRALAIGVHPYVTGAAHRIKYFEQLYDYINRHDDVVHWTGQQIHDWYAGRVPRPA